MKTITFLSAILLIADVLFAQIIHIPADYATIQQGINAANSGDTVLVSPGTYQENINFNGKMITVASLFLTSQDPYYILHTLIDGQQQGIVVTFGNAEDSTSILSGFTITNGGNVNYLMMGGGIHCYTASPKLTNLIITGNSVNFQGPYNNWGGGISCTSYSSPILLNVKITGNHSNYGGGLKCDYYSNPVLSNVSISDNSASASGGGIYCDETSRPVFDSINLCNIFFNSASDGNDIYSNAFLDVIVDTFSVLNPTEYYASPFANFSFDIRHGNLLPVNADLFVSPSGNNSNSGLTASDPLKTIHHAIAIMSADSLHPHTIHMLEGKYSPTTNNEIFPILLPAFMSLAGVSDTSVILDAENSSRVLKVVNNTSSHISGMTITRGSISGENGGGVFCSNSNPVFEHVIITGNSAQRTFTGWWGVEFWYGGFGGGIYFENSSPKLQHVQITHNTASYGGGIAYSGSIPTLEDIEIADNFAQIAYGWWYGSDGGFGGGMYFTNSSPKLHRIKVTQNTANSGGGISYSGSNPNLGEVTVTYNKAASRGGGILFGGSGGVFDSINRCNIYFNIAPEGRDLYSDSYVKVVADTFTVQHPTAYYAEPFNNFSFNVLHGKIPQVDADLFVSAYGDNANSGLSDTVPLRNISYAFPFLRADSLHHHTIHMLVGWYNYWSTSETYPIMIPDYIDLAGINTRNVLVYGNDTSEIFLFRNNTSSHLSGMTIGGGKNSGVVCLHSSPILENLYISYNSGNKGGGVNCDQSSPTLRNVTITNNSAIDFDWSLGNGGGIYCGANSNPVLENSTISYNQASSGGGIYCGINSSPILKNTVLSHNSAVASGGGACIDNFSGALFDSVKVFGNSAFYGGGVGCLPNAMPTLKNVFITSNTAEYGGGMSCTNSNSGLLTNDFISGNTASRQGGGIFFDGQFSVFDSINRCNIYFNEAPEGRDLYSATKIKVVADTFSVLHPTAYYAEPIDNFTFNILHGKIAQADADLYVSPAGNNANSGITAGKPLKTIQHANAIMRADSSHHYRIHLADGRYSPYTNNEPFPLKIINYIDLQGTDANNVILDAEGKARVVVFNNNSTSHLSGITITGGSVTNENGGGILFTNSSPTLENMTITGNIAASGGGILCNVSSSPKFQNVIISGNNASLSGGGIECHSTSSPTFENVSITDNSAPRGGGIGCYDVAAPVFKNVNITGNSAFDGGGIIISGSGDISFWPLVKIENGTISGNFATRGGGLYCENSKLTGIDLAITDNEATWGGGFFLNSSRPTLRNMTLAGNKADSAGGGIYSRSDNKFTMSKIVNSVLWNNLPQEVYFSQSYNMNAMIISYSDLKGGQGSIITSGMDTVVWQEGNIPADPLFVGGGAYPYSFMAGSPCRDAGMPDTTGLRLPLTDLAGGPRIWNERVDMGGYEWNNVGIGDLRTTNYDLRITSYPNPFSDQTTFSYEVPESSRVTLQVFNSIGLLVADLVNTTQPKGTYKIEWNAGGLQAGVYFYRVQAGKLAGGGKLVKL